MIQNKITENTTAAGLGDVDPHTIEGRPGPSGAVPLGVEAGQEVLEEGGEGVLQDGGPHPPHQLQLVGHVVDRDEVAGGGLLGHHRVQEGPRVAAGAGAAAARGVDGGEVELEALLLEVEFAWAGEDERAAEPGGAGGVDTVEHVDAQGGADDEVELVTYTHEVPECAMGVSRVWQGFVIGVSSICLGCVMDGCVMDVAYATRMYQRFVMDVSRVCLGCVNGVSMVCHPY